MATEYPVLKLPTSGFDRGRSLCRLGFPFVEVTSTYDEANNSFAFANAQLVFFPNEGIFTRILDAGRTPDGKHPVMFVETSSPGLRGQSGGPIFDSDVEFGRFRAAPRTLPYRPTRRPISRW